MRKQIAIILILSQFFLIVGQTFSAQSKKAMKIIKIKGNSFIANKGSEQSIQEGTVYSIQRNKKIIAKAKVVVVRKNICALKLIKLKSGYSIKKAIKLVLSGIPKRR